jgi:Fic family protein
MKASTSAARSIPVQRLYNEFLEMPDLRLTSSQAQRLCGLDAATCTQALEYLVEAGFLRRTDAGQYVRLADRLTWR